ncbi:MAG TPA: ParB N-terminal domain-containing protein [Sphingomicrobium sp.]
METHKRKFIVVEPKDCRMWQFIGRDINTVAQATLEVMKRSILANGLLVPPRAEKLASGGYEILDGLIRLLAAQMLIEEGHQIDFVVEVVKMSEDAKFQYVHAVNEARSCLSPIERGRFFANAIEHQYGNASACAEAFGLNKSTISRALDVVSVAKILRDKINDPRTISANQASWFMGYVREVPPDADPNDSGSEGARSNEALDAAAGSPLGSAPVVFRYLRSVLEPTHFTGDIEIVAEDDNVIGSVQPKKDGAVRINLSKEAGATELPALITAIKVAMSKLRAG